MVGLRFHCDEQCRNVLYCAKCLCIHVALGYGMIIFATGPSSLLNLHLGWVMEGESNLNICRGTHLLLIFFA